MIECGGFAGNWNDPSVLERIFENAEVEWRVKESGEMEL
jgi:hypothetical protein